VLTKVPHAGDGFFAGLDPHEVSWVPEYRKKGPGKPQRFELPQRYYDWSFMLAHFPASAEAISRLLPEGSGLEPVTIAPGIGIVSLAAFEYRKLVSLKPYNEMGVMFPVRLRPTLSLPSVPLFRPEWFADLGFYIRHLPVTRDDAREAGVKLWGFPKSLVEITFTEKERLRRCVWTEKGQHVLTLEVRTSNTTRQLRNFLAYSVLGGRLQQTLVQTYGDYDESRFGLDASFALGDGQVADELRRLGITNTATGRLYCRQAQGILPGPSPVPFSTVPAPLQATRVLKSIVARSRPKRPGPTVAIFGGGVAGLSAAHELAERGFDVTVYESREIPGGKARSMQVENSAGESRQNLPCEHGFRFFPGFYRHLPDTMSRIPYPPTGQTVVDNLVVATRLSIDFLDERQLVFPARFPVSFDDLGALLQGAGLLQERTGLTAKEITLYVDKIWQLLTSCEDRRLEEYEKIGWWDYIEGDKHSKAYERYLASTTRALVAADPKKASTRTVGSILLQMLFDLATPGVHVDRVLNGPTNDVWIDPWVAHLETLGVKWRRGTVQRLMVENRKLTGAVVDGDDVQADYYIAAVPVEAMRDLVKASHGLVEADPRLENIDTLSKDVESMTGIQFYFRERLPLEPGHYMHLDSQWALTSLAQAQFWKTDLSRYGDGTIRDILSVDISDWNTPGLNKKKAKDCSRQEIKEEVLAQLRASLPFLRGLRPATVYLDEAIQEKEGRVTNVEPLLVNVKEHWYLRPEATTGISNLFLASDYVRTYTDLATMEGANEAARRAVNAILDVSRSEEARCSIWNLHEPALLSPWRWLDRHRFQRGLDWSSDFPLALRGLQVGLSLANIAASAVRGIVEPNGAAAADPEVSPDEQEAIGDVMEAFIAALREGDPDGLRRLFAKSAVVTIGLRQAVVDELRPFVAPGVVNIEQIKSLYKMGGRVHVRLAVRISDPRAATGVAQTDGHIHAVFVPEDGHWLIGSLRYRREGQPAKLEALVAT
jgi:uncharacterized protein with NAD-binding domain and iron-sulfur cluster